MAILYPTSLDTFTNPTSGDTLASPDHALQHANINDAMEAVQTKLAIGDTVIGTYTAYTPTWTGGLTVGNGVNSARYCRVNKYIHDIGYFTLGSTSTLTGAFYKSLPVSAGGMFLAINGGVASDFNFFDTSANSYYPGFGLSLTSATTIIVRCFNSAGTYLVQTNLSATIPFTWATGDRIIWNIMYEAA